MDEQRKVAFEFARDTTKQLLSLATGIIGLEITFAKDFVHSISVVARWYAVLSWAAFLFSVVCGIWTLLALTGTLEQNDTARRVSIRNTNVTMPSILQNTTFIIGLALTVAFGATAR